jgi:hypothetical protein
MTKRPLTPEEKLEKDRRTEERKRRQADYWRRQREKKANRKIVPALELIVRRVLKQQGF